MTEFDNHSLVQFYHRNLAYIILIYTLFLSIYILRKRFTNLFVSLKILIIFLLFQAILGILTLLAD